MSESDPYFATAVPLEEFDAEEAEDTTENAVVPPESYAEEIDPVAEDGVYGDDLVADRLGRVRRGVNRAGEVDDDVVADTAVLAGDADEATGDVDPFDRAPIPWTANEVPGIDDRPADDPYAALDRYPTRG